MKGKFDVRSLVCGILLGAAAVFTVGAAGGKRTWEYTTQYYDSNSQADVAAITKLGDEGWELVGFFGGGAKSPGFIFKRER